jgi:hypothetical protein
MAAPLSGIRWADLKKILPRRRLPSSQIIISFSESFGSPMLGAVLKVWFNLKSGRPRLQFPSPRWANSRRRALGRLVYDSESARQYEMGRQFHWDHLCHPIAKARQVDACKQGFTAAQNDGRQRQVDLVDCSCE